jgi:hypothetical protein
MKGRGYLDTIRAASQPIGDIAIEQFTRFAWNGLEVLVLQS